MKWKSKLAGKIIIAVVIAGVVASLFLVSMMLNKRERAHIEEVVITTPYCDLLYPGKWIDSLRTESQEGEPYVVSFYGSVSKTEEHALFDVVFGADSGYHVGYVTGKNEEPVAVHVIYREIEHNHEWTEAQSNIIYAMQDDAGYLIDRIQLVHWEETGEILKTEIQTAYGMLCYPGKWGDRVKAEISEDSSYTVSFSGCFADNVWCPLFDIVFDDADNSLGYFHTEEGSLVSVGVRSYDLQEGVEWTPELEHEFYEMQEGLNDILAGLQLETETADEGVATVETPYGNLYYSNVWRENLYTQVSDDAGYIIAFYGTSGQIPAQRLFEIGFDADRGILLGWITETRVPVHVKFYEIDARSDWPQEDVDNLYAMQEEINVILSYLNQEQTFEPSA